MITQNAIVGYPIVNNLYPSGGGQVIPVTVTWEDAPRFNIDLRGARDLNEFGEVQSVFIDNRLNESEVILRCISTGHKITCPAGAQITSPLFGKEPLYTIESFSFNSLGTSGTVGFETALYFLNIFQSFQAVQPSLFRSAPVSLILPSGSTTVDFFGTLLPDTIINGFDLYVSPDIAAVGPFAAVTNASITTFSSTNRLFSSKQIRFSGATVAETQENEWINRGYTVAVNALSLRVNVTPSLPFNVRFSGSVYYTSI